MGGGIGPIIAGALAQQGHWRWFFCAYSPLLLITLHILIRPVQISTYLSVVFLLCSLPIACDCVRQLDRLGRKLKR